jgi:DNA repair protein RecO (recombination protein O)
LALLPTDAIVLQAFAYGESSRIVRLLTRTAGVQSALARGASRPRSRYSLMEPFAEGVASLYLRDSRDLQTLGGFELSRSRQGLAVDLTRFAAASLVAELVLRTASEAAQPELFEAVSTGLDRLMAAPPHQVETTALAVTWQVIATLGFGPELQSCLGCGEVLEDAAGASFDYTGGGIRCEACAPGLPGRAIPAHARAALACFARGEVAPVAVTEGHWRLLGRYLHHHLLDGTPLRSLEFLAATLQAS